MDNLDKQFIIDHIETENKLDNRKCNLRRTDKFGNRQNHIIYSNNTSGVTGVTWNKHHKKWQALINDHGKHVYLGYFKDFEEAVKARKAAEDIYYGEFSYDNSQLTRYF